MKTIPLTQGYHALVDDADHESLSQFKWSASRSRRDLFYAKGQDRNQKRVYMHRVILGLQRGDKRQVDHIDNNGLNNQQENLRICTYSQNQANSRKLFKNTSSQYKGVCWQKKDQKWCARIRVNRKRIYLGEFQLEAEAASAYNNAAIKYYGEFAKLNELPEH